MCAAPLAVQPRGREQRKTVTVLFCDVTGSTALGESTDPEALRVLLARYFDRMKGIVEAHGGTVEKFIGDAVMAVFGVPQAHEDDAVRAVRAAFEMRGALPELGVQARIGLNTGEVVTGTEERLATGDAVNIAARLEQAASPGEILVGESTLTLVRDTVEAHAIEPLELKGKTAPVSAYRLVALTGQPRRRHEVPLVDREDELALLRSAYDQCLRDCACRLFTVIGAAGIGKSRLVLEFLNDLEARVVSGRCLPYGEGITYRPVLEVLKQLSVLPADAATAASLRSLLGQSEEGTSAEEIAWSFRKLLEEQAPLVCVFDDIHWGEETFLDLVDHVTLLSTGAPILLLCLARPELVERRPPWPVALRLEPLPEPDVDELIPATLPDDLRTQIVDASGGNPLFVIEMVAMSAEAKGEIRVPPTLRALVAARLDQLADGERSVLERGAVEGAVFHRGAVRALSDDGEVTSGLAALVRRDLIRPDKAQLPGEDAFRFRHLLIREAAYDALPKATRAELHARFAAWLDRHGRDLVELDEILGRHLERAARCRAELGQPDAELSERAGTYLAAAGRRALLQGDDRAAARLLEDACKLISSERPLGVELRIELGRALAGAGELERAAAALDEAQRFVPKADARLALHAALFRVNLRSQTDADISMVELITVAERAIPVFSERADDWGLARSWFLLHWARFRTGQCTDSIEAAERMVEHARRAGDAREEIRGLGAIAMATLWGPTPVEEGLRRLDELVERARRARLMEAFVDRVRGGLFAMNGRFEDGREQCRRAVEIYEELGHPISAIGVGVELQRIERQAGRLEVAEQVLREALERLRALGDVGYVGWIAAQLARVLAEQGDRQEARELARYCREALQPDHAFAQISARIAEAIALRENGSAEEAEATAIEALALAEMTDNLDLHGDALIALADLDQTAGRLRAARERAAHAIELYEQKGDIISAARERERFRALLEEAPE